MVLFELNFYPIYKYLDSPGTYHLHIFRHIIYIVWSRNKGKKNYLFPGEIMVFAIFPGEILVFPVELSTNLQISSGNGGFQWKWTPHTSISSGGQPQVKGNLR